MCNLTVSIFLAEFAYHLCLQFSDIPDEVDGAPCAIQVVTPRFQDEACLRAADIIDRAIRD